MRGYEEGCEIRCTWEALCTIEAADLPSNYVATRVARAVPLYKAWCWSAAGGACSDEYHLPSSSIWLDGRGVTSSRLGRVAGEQEQDAGTFISHADRLHVCICCIFGVGRTTCCHTIIHGPQPIAHMSLQIASPSFVGNRKSATRSRYSLPRSRSPSSVAACPARWEIGVPRCPFSSFHPCSLPSTRPSRLHLQRLESRPRIAPSRA